MRSSGASARSRCGSGSCPIGGAARVLGLLGLAAGSVLGGMLGAIDLTIPVAGGAVVFVGCCLLAAVAFRGELASEDLTAVVADEVDAELR